MAATDQNYRTQYGLDVVFGVSSILMLISVLWMFVQDYNREFTHEQRTFRDVETALAQRTALEQIPSLEEFNKAEKDIERARAERDKNADKIEALRAEAREVKPKKEKADARYQDIKASLDSIKSFYDLEVEANGMTEKATGYKAEVEDLQRKLDEAQNLRDDLDQKIKEKQAQADVFEKPVADALGRMKKITDQFDTQVNAAIAKKWTIWDSVRHAPIIDGFASPIKIHQYTIDTIPIDYNFKYATRFDRCTTCHEGIDRPTYTRGALASLTTISPEQQKKLDEARQILAKRRQATEGLPEAKNMPRPDDLQLNEISRDELTAPRISEFAAHPRLDLFAGSNSKHPAERFGCTSCHSGQGSATSFNLASHTPTDFHTEERWKDVHGWESNHYWDFPMLPMRFVESSCVKCHHEVTDLITTDNRKEAPKLLRGYTLLREFGCFGCHEINGRKKGQEIGPDIRLENYPPVEDLPPAERVKIEADPDLRPGNMRKVGPSLMRLVEKSNKEWTVKWLRAPREFRPDTKMPHFYGLSNNDKSVLPEDQKTFPDTEIQAIAYYLFEASGGYVKEMTDRLKDSPEVRRKDADREQQLLEKIKLSEDEKKELAAVQGRIRLREKKLLTDQAPGYDGDPAQGRLLFTERGCLACHSHDSTTKPQGSAGDKTYAPPVMGEAQFGPNLSQIVEKLGTAPGDKKSARVWLIQWLLDPHVHSPRSRMPVTHLEPKQAADIAAWLLSQPTLDLGPQWNSIQIKQPTFAELQKLAHVYLIRLMSPSNLDKVEKKQLDQEQMNYVSEALPAEDKELLAHYDEAGLKKYLGRKAIGRLGCFACHDIPGFESAKPIGVELNDWGKKDPTRLAFEDIKRFVDKDYKVVPQLTDEAGKPIRPTIEGKTKRMPYEQFFYDLLVHHQREGFLNQKLLDPRSYDYDRIRAWDDRSRMPQFRFARSRRHADESDQDYEARANLDEAEAREAVMTFILGLVAEPVPAQNINLPSGDRLAVVKGRQVLEKFNCAGCHLIQPGVFEFKNTPDVAQRLDELAANYEAAAREGGDYFFPNHFDWLGVAPSADNRLTAAVARPELNEEDAQNPALQFRLAHAFRYKDVGGSLKNIRASYSLRLSPKDMTYPPPAVAANKDKLHAFLKDQGPYGGTFTELLVNFLIDKDTKTYEREANGDSPKARISAPPVLIGQGERTQADWLYQFLLNPQPVRRMTVLRMPRFNMSPDEARALVGYFTGVDRLLNTGIDVSYPFKVIPQQEALQGEYWKEKTTEYVERLMRTKTKDAQGKEKTRYEMRVEELKPLWEQIEKDYKEEKSRAQAKYQEAKTAAEKIEAAMQKEKEDAKKKLLDDEVKDAKRGQDSWSSELKRLETLADEMTVSGQEKVWKEREAYIADGFRLLANTQLCLNCHEVGPLQPNQKLQEGPPLQLTHQRLRPGWTGRWLANPQRFLTYNSVMPSNFPMNAVDQLQQWFVGSSPEQLTAVRDVLMIYPRAASMPLNRYWALPLPGALSGGNTGKTGGKK